MPTYPDIVSSVKATTPFQYSENFRVLSTEFENGQENRRLIDGYPRRNFMLRYGPVRWEQAQTLRQFYSDMKGPYTAFTFFSPQIQVFTKELAWVATSGGGTTFDLPSREAQTYSLYRNNTFLNPGSQWTFSYSPSVDTPDRATVFSVSPGDIFTWSFTGHLGARTRFVSKPLIFTDTKDLYSYIQVELKSLYPEER